MTVYMVERSLPGIGIEQLAAAQRAAITTSERFSFEGRPVRYIRSTWLPEEGRCLCLFDATDQSLVEEVNEVAQLPFTRVLPALDLTP